MKTFSVTQTINATAATIWSILTDSAKYADWNESVEKIEGDISLDQEIKVYAKISPGQAFAVKVIEFTPHEKMVWRSGMPLGLFQGVRTFTLTGDPNGPIEFHMHEVFSGLMAPLITRAIPDLTPSFEEFATSLKHQAEGTA